MVLSVAGGCFGLALYFSGLGKPLKRLSGLTHDTDEAAYLGELWFE